MTKRRDFIRKGMMGLATGLVVSRIPLKAGPDITSKISTGQQMNWQNDPEWIRIKYGDWGGPGVEYKPGAMDNILLKDYAPRTTCIIPETFVAKAKYGVFDSHIHALANSPEEIADWVKTMDQVGIETSIVLTGSIGNELEKHVNMLKKAYPGRFQVFCGIDLKNIEKKDYAKRVVEELERCYETGACGVGEITDKGFGLTNDPSLPENERLHPDDERLDSFWEKCAELSMPVSLHVADHPSCWNPLDVFQERSPDYQHFNLYSKNILTFNEIIAFRDKTLAKHPNTIFIACHLGNQGHDLKSLALALDKYPNLYLDTSARDYELGRTPRASRDFLNKHCDRVLFGTDMGREKSMYQIHWRLLETADECIPGRVGWRYYGLELPDSTLEALYRGTAKKVFNL